MSDDEKLVKFDSGNVYMWIENGSSIMLKAVTILHLDPVELSSEQAREIGLSLLKMADDLDGVVRK